MLSESQVKQAKAYLFEYKQCLDGIKEINETIEMNPFSNKLNQWSQEKEMLVEKKQEIETIVEKELGVNLQELSDRTSLGIMAHIRQQQEQQPQKQLPLQPDIDRSLEIVKEPPKPIWTI